MLDVYTMRAHPSATVASKTLRDPYRFVARVARRSPRIKKARWTTTSAPLTNLATSSGFVTSPWMNSVRLQPWSPGVKGRRAIATIDPTPEVFSRRRMNGRPISPVAPVTATRSPFDALRVEVMSLVSLVAGSPTDAPDHGRCADRRAAAPNARADRAPYRDCGRIADGPQTTPAPAADGRARNDKPSATFPRLLAASRPRPRAGNRRTDAANHRRRSSRHRACRHRTTARTHRCARDLNQGALGLRLGRSPRATLQAAHSYTSGHLAEPPAPPC